MDWTPAPKLLTLANDDVHVWCAQLDTPPVAVHRLQETLAADELDRAARFRFEGHRRHFIVRRGVLRAILGHYLGVEPGVLRFAYSPYGKPALAAPDSGRGLNFNLSHSQGLALYAFSRGRELGIDIEALRLDIEYERIARSFFSPREQAALMALPSEQRGQAFFCCWTRKEAYIKARGEGLSMPLHQFDVSLVPGEAARLLETRPDPGEGQHWSLRNLEPASGYFAALAVEGQGWQLFCWRV
jgi:4'-phosphopantetheinyl transferase